MYILCGQTKIHQQNFCDWVLIMLTFKHFLLTKELTNDEQETIVCSLLELCNKGHLLRGAITDMAGIYQMSQQCISKILNNSVIAQQNGNYSLTVVHNQKLGMTYNLQYNPLALSDTLKQLPHCMCTNQCNASENLHVTVITCSEVCLSSRS